MPSGQWLPAAVLVAGLTCVVFHHAARSEVRGNDEGAVSLLEARLHMYPVDEGAMKQYLSHTEGSGGLLHGASRGAAAGGAREESIDSFVGGKQLRRDSAHRLGAKKQRLGTGHRRLELFLDGESSPATQRASLRVGRHMAAARVRLVPRDKSQMLSEESQLLGAGSEAQPLGEGYHPRRATGGEGTTTQVLATRGRTGESLAGGPPCAGPVRHMDSAECVAKKAMAQAMQAEHDAQAVDEGIGRHSKDNTKFDRWEDKTHSALSSEMHDGFSQLKKMLRRNGRRVNSQDRQIMVGDATAVDKASKFAMREAKDMAQVSQRISRMEQQAKIISMMKGPAGPAGPRGPRGQQGVRGAQGERGPQGDMGAMGETGRMGYNGMAGNNGHRGPAGHFLDIKGKLGKQSTSVDRTRLKKFADSLRVMESMVHRLGALRKPPTPNPRP